jgi:hypothetical protein
VVMIARLIVEGSIHRHLTIRYSRRIFLSCGTENSAVGISSRRHRDLDRQVHGAGLTIELLSTLFRAPLAITDAT